MKATPKQWIFLGLFTGVVVMACALVGSRAVAPSPRSRTTSGAGAARTRPDADRKPVQSFAWRSVSHALASPASGEAWGQGGVGGKGTPDSRQRVSPRMAEVPSGDPSRLAPDLDNPKLVTYSLDKYMTIADLDLFRSVVSQQQVQPAEANPPSPSRQPQPAEVKMPLPSRQVSPFPASWLVGKPSPESPKTESPPSPSIETPPPQRESPQDIAVTGYVQRGDEWYIVLENVATQEGRMVSPGDQAFGYQIESLDVAADQLVLVKDGHEVRLKLGNNKREVRPTKKPSSNNQESSRNPPEGGESWER